MTLTLAVLNGARRILWVVTGADKQTALAGLVAGDPSVIASRVRRSGALILVDADAVKCIQRRRDPRLSAPHTAILGALFPERRGNRRTA